MTEKILNCLEILETNDTFISENVWTTLEDHLLQCFLPEFPAGQDRPCNDSDFTTFKQSNERHIYYLKIVFERIIIRLKLQSEDLVKLEPALIVDLILICAENSKINYWNQRATVAYCKDILNMIVDYLNWNSLNQLLVKRNFEKSRQHFPPLLKPIMKKLIKKLQKHNFKSYPAAVEAYKFILEQITFPDLHSNMNLFLPPALLLIDDFVPANRMVGVSCLGHIIKNVPDSELKYSGIGEVIYKAMEPLLHTREVELTAVLLPVIIQVVEKIDDSKQSTRWSRIDDVMDIILEKMELEGELKMKKVYSDSMNGLLTAAGANTVRWGRRLVRIFQSYLRSLHEDTRPLYQALQTFLVLSNPVSKLHSDILLSAVLMNVYECEERHQLMGECFHILWQDLTSSKSHFLDILMKHKQFQFLVQIIPDT